MSAPKNAANAAGAKIESAANSVSGQNQTQGTNLYNQATSLASNTIQYAKETAGLAKHKAEETKDAAANNADAVAHKQTGQTLGGLVDQAKALTSDVLGVAKTYVEVGQEKAAEAADAAQSKAGDVKGTAQCKTGNAANNAQAKAGNAADTAKAKVGDAADTAKGKADEAQRQKASYVDQARNAAANVIGTAQSYLQTAEQKAAQQDSTNPNTLTGQVAGAAQNATKAGAQIVADTQTTLEQQQNKVAKTVQEAKLQTGAAAKVAGAQVNKTLNG